MRGPVDYIIVGFKGNTFTGEILSALEKAKNDGTIAVLSLALVIRDAEGNVTSVEITDPELLEIMQDFDMESGLISDEDVQEVGELLEDNSSAGLLIVEQLWAKGLKAAIVDNGGVLISDGRIHPDASRELEEKEV